MIWRLAVLAHVNALCVCDIHLQKYIVKVLFKNSVLYCRSILGTQIIYPMSSPGSNAP